MGFLGIYLLVIFDILVNLDVLTILDILAVLGVRTFRSWSYLICSRLRAKWPLSSCVETRYYGIGDQMRVKPDEKEGKKSM